MDLPISWLSDFVDIDCTTKEFADAMTLSGSKVEGYQTMGGNISGIVIGRIEKIEKHPHADKLVVTQVNVGKDQNLQIVTGATNVYEGAYIPVATDGATLDDGSVIKKSELRGVESCGMMCSVEELGCDRHDFPEAPENGIYIFENEQELGADVVEVMDLKDDVVEFEITSNRPDCFSIIGLSREAAATFKKEFHQPIIKLNEQAEGNIDDMVQVEIKNPELCPRYTARIIKDVKIEPSPRWLRKRLKAAGVRPINNIVDITNYVMLELGQPMHAFSIETIAGSKIIVRNANDGETITTLDGNERVLDSSMLVISDCEKAVAVAGVMGGENSKIQEGSQAVLFESANFNGSNVRITAKKLGMRTDASSKYEKGIDPNITSIAADRAVQLVELLGAGKVVKGSVDCYPNVRSTWELSYDPDWINKLLGTNISESEMIEIFERIELKVDKANRKVTIPTFRPDLESQADLAEEVARFYGYDKIEPTLATGTTTTVGKMTYEQTINKIVKDTVISEGYCESMSFSFESPKVYDKLLIPTESDLRKAIVISNPLGEDFSIMRTVPLNGMLTSLSTNYNRRNPSAALFEVGKIYIPKSLPVTELPEEKSKLIMGCYGSGDFFDIKGVVEHVMHSVGLEGHVDYSPERNIPFMHPGRTASIAIKGKNSGYVGELHPTVAENYGIGAKVYVAVIDIDLITENSSLVSVYKPLPKYPATTRDISMLIKDNVIVKEIENTIKTHSGELLEKLSLFDIYKGKQIDDGFKSVSYSLTFRASDRTLTDDEVNSRMDEVLKSLKDELGAVLRDK